MKQGGSSYRWMLILSFVVRYAFSASMNHLQSKPEILQVCVVAYYGNYFNWAMIDVQMCDSIKSIAKRAVSLTRPEGHQIILGNNATMRVSCGSGLIYAYDSKNWIIEDAGQKSVGDLYAFYLRSLKDADPFCVRCKSPLMFLNFEIFPTNIELSVCLRFTLNCVFSNKILIAFNDTVEAVFRKIQENFLSENQDQYWVDCFNLKKSDITIGLCEPFIAIIQDDKIIDGGNKSFIDACKAHGLNYSFDKQGIGQISSYIFNIVFYQRSVER